MAKPISAGENFSYSTFPASGIDLSQGFDSQRPGTTPIGLNVRLYEAQTLRGRGGSRAGLGRYIDDQLPTNGTAIQLLDMIVDPQAVASLDIDDGTFDDPSSDGPPSSWGIFKNSRNPGRKIRNGGSGRQQQKNKPRPLTVTADNQNKAFGETFTFAGSEFTSSGLDIGDSISACTITSTGSPSTAPKGKYPIRIANPQGLPPGKYKPQFVNGTMTVGGIEFVQGTDNYDIGTEEFLIATPMPQNCTAGNLLVVVGAVGSDPTVPGAVTGPTDSFGTVFHLATSLQKASGGEWVALWYGVCAGTGPNTISVSYIPFVFPNGMDGGFIAEYSGTSGSPLDGFATHEDTVLNYSVPVATTTGPISVNNPNELMIAFTIASPGRDSTQDTLAAFPGFAVRANTHLQTGYSLLIFQDNVNVSATQAVTGLFTGGVLDIGTTVPILSLGASFK